jgi:Taurine catabolism dioxygenase TauD, TfdA family
MDHIGIDLGATNSHIVVLCASGGKKTRRKLKTGDLPRRLMQQPPSNVVMEACTQSPAIARAAIAAKHNTKVVPAHEHVPANESGAVQTPVFYPAELKVLWHNENSFHDSWPSLLFFSCVQPAVSGGATPLAETRLIYERLWISVSSPRRVKGGAGFLDW